jgi:hypothetical protein
MSKVLGFDGSKSTRGFNILSGYMTLIEQK